MKKSGSLKTLLASVVAFIILLFGSNPQVQEALSYYTGLSDDFSEYLGKDGQVAGASKGTGVINRVVDGDTVVLEDGRTIRYLYVDTPETRKPGTPVQCYGKEASSFNKAFTGAKVILKKDKEAQDRYGRDLRIVFLEGRNPEDINQSINADLVRYGFARVKIYKPNDTYEPQLRELEEKAKKDKQGAWKDCEEPFES